MTGEESGEPEQAEATTPEREATRGIADDVAPRDIEQPDLVLNRIKDMLRDERKAEELSDATGMSIDELNQFVRKFEKAPDLEPGAPRTLEVDPGEDRQFDPNRELTGPLPTSTVSSRSERGPNAVPQDEAGGNTQGIRTAVPPEYSPRFDAFRRSLSGGAATSGDRSGSER